MAKIIRIESELRQLHEDCEVLKKRNGTYESTKQHLKNDINRYCRMVEFYDSLGCSTRRALDYAKGEFNIG